MSRKGGVVVILYLTSKTYMNILDFLNDKEDLIIQKYVGEFDLKDFLSNAIQRLGHVEAIVIDRTSLIDTEDVIIETLKGFKSISGVKIICFIPEEDQSLVHELIRLGIFNIITESDVDKLKQEIEMCLLEDMTEHYIKNKFGLGCDEKDEAVIYFKGKQITIGVVGSQHRVGTTTVAMQFACYLNSIGAKVSYVEANDSGHMKLIAEHYEMEKSGEGYLYKEIAFEPLDSKNETAFECVVYDLGVLDEKVIQGITNSDIRVICGANGPHERGFLEKSKRSLEHMDCNIVLACGGECLGENIYRTTLREYILCETGNDNIFVEIVDKYFEIT